MTDMMPRPTPDFTMNQDWPSPLGPPEQSSDAASVGTSDIGASFLASWPPILEPTHPLPPEITASRIVKPKRLSPGVMPTPTSSSSHDSSTAGSMQASCSCLQHVVFLVHELETAKMGSVDGQMASHKEAVDYGRAMLVCELCSRRPENLMMLTFLSERLLQLSEAVLARLARPDGEERLAFVFGELEIDSAPEWDVLVSSLVALQLGALRDLLGRLKKSAETARADMVYEKVVDAEKLTGELMERLRLTVKPLYAFKYPYSSTL
ncbi:hypothetical protein BDW02DRAFT_179261 [Decorospora gaudefroyi]|uniref:Aflatoxin regulatory protein domain-containing protein n=1 Tax=Decorospora gaudefroyi TaxID=184978 RepID=A0A6A5JXY5_9PLEO|nr:hypothetical protein BDW02DRAFT_179261 [Decorospora gaudefroyi]